MPLGPPKPIATERQIRAVLCGADAVKTLARDAFAQPRVPPARWAEVFTISRADVIAWVRTHGLPADVPWLRREDDGADGLFLVRERRGLLRARWRVWLRERGHGSPADGEAFDTLRAAEVYAVETHAGFSGWFYLNGE